MKKLTLSAAALTALSLALAGTVAAQDSNKEVVVQGYGTKAKGKLGDYEEIVIKKKGSGDSKLTVEIKDGEVTVNGKPLEDFDSEAVSVRRRKPATISYGQATSPFQAQEVIVNGFPMSASRNKAFLGISSEETSQGIKVASVVDESAAQKAGLKEGDIILKIDDKQIKEPSDITEEIRKHKPEEKVTITYKRDGKEAKATATLTENKNSFNQVFGSTFSAPRLEELRNLEGFRYNDPGQFYFEAPAAPGAPGAPAAPGRPGFRTLTVTGRPMIGIRAQDTEEGNGAKVLNVNEESAAEKAGIQKDDIITSFDGKKVTNADELSAAAREAREKTSIEVKYTRGGKANTATLKIPKKLKTTSL